MNEDQSQQEDTKTAVLIYDADAPQRVPMQTERRGKLYKVTHRIDAIKRESILEYERALQVRLTDADTGESDEQDARAVTSNTFAAAQDFYDKVSNAPAEGYTFKNPAAWKEELSKSDKGYVVNGILLAVEFRELPLASESEACPAEDEDTSTYHMRCIFNGQLVDLEHTLRAPSAEDLTTYTGIMGRQLLVQGTQFGQTDQRIPSRALALEVLYDRLKMQAKGYADRVPIHHKKAVVQRHFKKIQKATTKNESGSPS
jgi:hypothetical protein